MLIKKIKYLSMFWLKFQLWNIRVVLNKAVFIKFDNLFKQIIIRHQVG